MTHDDKITEIVHSLAKAARCLKSGQEYVAKHDLSDHDAERLNTALRDVVTQAKGLDDAVFESSDIPESGRVCFPWDESPLDEKPLAQFESARIGSVRP